MNPVKLVLVTVAILTNTALIAQPILNDLKLNEDIKWLAVAYRDFDFRSISSQSSILHDNGTSQNSLLKYKVAPPVLTQPHIQTFDIHDNIMDYLQDEEVYTDEELNNPVLTREERNKFRGLVEVVETFDAATFETFTEEIVTSYTHDEIAYMRVKYLIYLNEEDEFIVIPLSFAPLYVTEERGQITKKPICWLPIVVHQERADIDNPTIPWMMRSFFPLFRGTTTVDIVSEEIIFSEAAKRAVVDIQESEDEGNLVGFSGVHTWKEALDGYSGEGIKDLVLIEDWWWDDETKTLHSLYLGFGFVAPAIHPSTGETVERVTIYKMLRD